LNNEDGVSEMYPKDYLHVVMLEGYSPLVIRSQERVTKRGVLDAIQKALPDIYERKKEDWGTDEIADALEEAGFQVIGTASAVICLRKRGGS